MNRYPKTSLSLDQQLALLAERGLVFDDEARARHYLTNISYFRLSAYTRPFYLSGQAEHQFISGTRFEQVLELYVFDRELRLLLLDAIERLEVALRARLTDVLTTHYQDPFCYLDPALFTSRYNHDWLRAELCKKTEGHKMERFIAHYRQSYPDAPPEPPIWMAMELLTFAQISSFFAHLREPEVQKAIANHFGWPHAVLTSWFRSLSDLRNWCAHHSRVWNRELGTAPLWPKKGSEQLAQVSDRLQLNATQSLNSRKRLYFLLVIIESLLLRVSP
ncbi:MAG: Abi family protein, partial [Vibrionaceae bacterium]